MAENSRSKDLIIDIIMQCDAWFYSSLNNTFFSRYKSAHDAGIIPAIICLKSGRVILCAQGNCFDVMIPIKRFPRNEER